MVSSSSSILVAIEFWCWLVLLLTIHQFSCLVSVRGATAVLAEDHHHGTNNIRNNTTTLLSRPPFLLGVMVDAARHEFSVDWLELFMNDIHRMNFNAIHLTLTNDQRFSFTTTVKDDNNDEKNKNNNNRNTNNNTRYYTGQDLNFLAQHAQSLDNMTIIPEVSLPFYASSWVDDNDRYNPTGIHNIQFDQQQQKQQQLRLLPPPCPRYVCSTERAIPVSGTNVPLDIRHPQIKEIIRRVLFNVIQNLNKPQYIHLGITTSKTGSSSISNKCWKEVIQDGGEAPDYDLFEKTLAGIIVNDLGYQPQQVIRGVDGGDNRKNNNNDKYNIDNDDDDNYSDNSDNNIKKLMGDAILSQYQDHHNPRLLLNRQHQYQQQHHHQQQRQQQQQHDSSFFSYILQPKELNMATALLQDTGWDIYQHTIEIMNLHRSNYDDGSFRGMIISTEAMHPRWFDERNVRGRLLVVSMAVRDFVESAATVNNSNNNKSNDKTNNTTTTTKNKKSTMMYTDQSDFEKSYLLLCNKSFQNDSVTPSSKFCHRLGGSDSESSSSSTTDVNDGIVNSHRKVGKSVSTHNNQNHNDSRLLLYKKGYLEMWKNWADEVCNRFTETRKELELQTLSVSITNKIQDEAFASYWQELSEDTFNQQDIMTTIKDENTIKSFDGESSIRNDKKGVIINGSKFVRFSGFIVDTVDDIVSHKVLQDLMERIMVPLGLNTLQLSLINRLGCSLQLKSIEQLYHLVPKPRNVDPLSDDVLRKIVRSSERLAIELIPEISITTQATGWYHAGFLVDCPSTLCDSGEIANDINRGSLLPVVLNTIRKIRDIFSSSFIHLGSDERNSSKACWKESGKEPNYNLFEERLTGLLNERKWYDPSTSILRWENREGIIYPERTGGITHYQYSTPNNNSTRSNIKIDDPFFVSLSISPEKEPWTIYQETRRSVGASPRGILAKISLKDFENHKKGLIAFALGLSLDVPIMEDPTALDAYIADIICDDDGSYLCSVPLKYEVGRSKHTTPRGLLLCKAMTSLTSHSVMRSYSQSLDYIDGGD